MEVKEKVALVTGSAAGIGLAITTEFLKTDMKGVIMVDNNSTRGEEICSELGIKFGRKRVHFYQCDITNDDEFEGAFKRAIEIFGRLDIVVNNAGIFTETKHRRMIDVNLMGTLKGVLLGLQYMSKEKNPNGGTIINISSIAAMEIGKYVAPVYAATKGGILSLTRAYGYKSYYDRTGVRIMAICPSATPTGLIKKSEIPPGWEEEFANMVKQYKSQKPDVIGRGAVYILERGETGSSWIIEDSKLYKSNIPKRESYSVLVKDLGSEN